MANNSQEWPQDLCQIIDKLIENDRAGLDIIEEMDALVAWRDAYVEVQKRQAERSGEINQLKFLKHWATLHRIRIEVDDLDHILSSLEQLPDQPLARETLQRLTPTKPKEPEHQVTRFEVIDHRQCVWCRGHKVANYLQKNGEYKEMPCEKCDGSGTMGGRVYAAYSNAERSVIKVDLSYQDDGRTLKVFVSDREQQGGEN